MASHSATRKYVRAMLLDGTLPKDGNLFAKLLEWLFFIYQINKK